MAPALWRTIMPTPSPSTAASEVNSSAHSVVAAIADVSPMSSPPATAPPNAGGQPGDAEHQTERGGGDRLGHRDHPARRLRGQGGGQGAVLGLGGEQQDPGDGGEHRGERRSRRRRPRTTVRTSSVTSVATAHEARPPMRTVSAEDRPVGPERRELDPLALQAGADGDVDLVGAGGAARWRWDRGGCRGSGRSVR